MEKFKTHDDDPDKTSESSKKKKSKTKTAPPKMQDYQFKEFRKLCMNLSQENKYLQKTAIIKEFFDKVLSKGIYCFLTINYVCQFTTFNICTKLLF